MNENDLIAEFIKEQHPDLLRTFDFALFKFGKAVEEMAKNIIEGIKKIDFSSLKEEAAKVNRLYEEKQNESTNENCLQGNRISEVAKENRSII